MIDGNRYSTQTGGGEGQQQGKRSVINSHVLDHAVSVKMEIRH